MECLCLFIHHTICSLQCRRFHRARANGFNRESAMLKLPKRGGFFSPLPLPPLLFFALTPTVRVTISTLPNLPLS